MLQTNRKKVIGMNRFDAIFSRRSIRRYENERLDWTVLADILEYANKLPMLIEGIAVEFKLVSNIEEKQGFGSPLSIKAPYYLCISSEEKEGYLLNAGYLMQQMNLYIASKGLGTCFFMFGPGHKLKTSMKYSYVLTLAFGKTKLELYRDSSEAKRLPEEELILYKEEVPSEVKQILAAARLAPSSFNSQPWRFVAYKNRIHVFARKTNPLIKSFDNTTMLNMGIMLANLLLAAEELWVDLSLTKSESLKSKSFSKNEYVCTVMINK